MHGLLEYAEALRIVFTSYDSEIIIQTPTGHKVDICPPHVTHFEYVITEACRDAAMKQLDERTEEENGNEANVTKKHKKTPGHAGYFGIR